MNRLPEKDMSASVRARLLNLARSSGRNFQELVIRYTVERFLARLAVSEHRGRFVLKGAMLYVAWKLDDQRTTMDLDLLGFGNPDPDHLIEDLRQICGAPLADDGLSFDLQGITAAPIREGAVYHGVRAIIPVRLGVMTVRLQVDVGFGDAVIPDPKLSEFPSLLADHGPTVRAYRPETVIAEKFNAMVVLGMANSRMKDYFDIWMLSQRLTFEGRVLREAILGTFANRLSQLPEDGPIGLSGEFAHNESKNLQWKGFVKKHKLNDSVPDLDEIVSSIREFLMPVVFSITKSAQVPGVWLPSNRWED